MEQINGVYDTSALIDGCEELGIHLSQEQLRQFLVYYEYLIEQNKVMNLTAITDWKEVVQKHFLDSLSIAKIEDMEHCGSLIDVGTGAGFPGIPIKIAFPDIKITLIDSLNKRINFLNKTIDKLQCKNIEALHGRAEDFGKNTGYREKYDICVSRAVANLSSLSEYCLPFVRTGGKFISYKSINIDTELQESKNALFLLGGKLENKVEFDLPGSNIARTLVIVKKERPTPGKYPRKAGLPSKEPLGGRNNTK